MEETTILPSLRLAPQNMTPTSTRNIVRNAETTLPPSTVKAPPTTEPAPTREAALDTEAILLRPPPVRGRRCR